MVSEDAALESLTQERAYLARRIDLSQSAMQRTVFVFLGVVAAAAGLYWGDLFPSQERLHLIFCLTQIAFFLLLFILAQVAHQNIMAGHIAAIECAMNQLCAKKVAIWESVVAPHCIRSFRAAFFWTIVALITMPAVLLLAFAATAWFSLHLRLYATIVLIECPLVFALLIWSWWDINRVQQHSGTHLLTRP